MNSFQGANLANPSQKKDAPRRPSAPAAPQLSLAMASALHQVLDENHFSEPGGGTTSQAILANLFVRGVAVKKQLAQQVFTGHLLEGLGNSGLLHEADGCIQSHFQAQRYKGLIFFSDFYRESEQQDYVLQVGPAGRYLADLTIRRPVASALDLGCGCGIHALLMARHCTNVTATDINPRALQLTRLNASINGIQNVETLEGSFFEPLKHRSFDLITANLPYVISPESRHIYRDARDARGTGLFSLIRALPAHLNELGFSHVLANWVQDAGRPIWQPVRQALLGLPVDSWLIHNGSKNASEYADMWLDIPKTEQPAYDKKKADWLAWYRDQQIEMIALGALTLRRREAAGNWSCSASVPTPLSSAAGDQLFDLFTAQDALASMQGADALEKARLVCCSQPGFEVIPLDAGRWRLHTGGMQLAAEVSAGTLKVIRLLDGVRTLSEAKHLAKTGEMNLDSDIRLLISLGLLKCSQPNPG